MISLKKLKKGLKNFFFYTSITFNLSLLECTRNILINFIQKIGKFSFFSVRNQKYTNATCVNILSLSCLLRMPTKIIQHERRTKRKLNHFLSLYLKKKNL